MCKDEQWPQLTNDWQTIVDVTSAEITLVYNFILCRQTQSTLRSESESPGRDQANMGTHVSLDN